MQSIHLRLRYLVAPNLVNQGFEMGRLDKPWFGDITYITTDEGWFYFATVSDAYHKEVPGFTFTTKTM